MALGPGTLFTANFLVAAAANFLFFANANIFNLLPLYIQRLGGTETEIGTIMGVSNLSAILLQPVAGGLIDRFGRKRFIVLGTSIGVGTSLAFAASRTLGLHFYVIRFFQGVAFACYFTASLTLVADIVPPGRRAEAIGIFGVSGLVTTALAPALGELVALRYGFAVLFLAAAAIEVGSLVTSIGVQEPPSAPTAGKAVGPIWPGRRRTLLAAFLATFVYGLGFGTVFTFVPTYVRSVGLPRVGPFYVFYAITAIAVRFFGGRFADTIGRRRIIIPAMVGQAMGGLVLAGLGSTLVLTLTGVVIGLSHGFLYPALTALMIDRAGAGARGKVLGAFTATSLLGGAVGAFAFGIVAGAYGYPIIFFLMAGTVLAGTVVFLLYG